MCACVCARVGGSITILKFIPKIAGHTQRERERAIEREISFNNRKTWSSLDRVFSLALSCGCVRLLPVVCCLAYARALVYTLCPVGSSIHLLAFWTCRPGWRFFSLALSLYLFLTLAVLYQKKVQVEVRVYVLVVVCVHCGKVNGRRMAPRTHTHTQTHTGALGLVCVLMSFSLRIKPCFSPMLDAGV